jgi:hypothetical protein
MTNEQDTFTFREVAMATGITSKTIRNWLDSKTTARNLCAEIGREEGKWRRFPFADAIIIALTGCLTKFGVNVENALYFSKGCLEITTSGNICSVSFESFLSEGTSFYKNELRVWKEGDSWVFSMSNEEDDRPIPHAFITIRPWKIARELAVKLELIDGE